MTKFDVEEEEEDLSALILDHVTLLWGRIFNLKSGNFSLGECSHAVLDLNHMSVGL
jgi:hypothetical protein